VRFQVLAAITVFWDVALCSRVEADRRFRGTYCLHYQGDRSFLNICKTRSRKVTRIISVEYSGCNEAKCNISFVFWRVVFCGNSAERPAPLSGMLVSGSQRGTWSNSVSSSPVRLIGMKNKFVCLPFPPPQFQSLLPPNCVH
jgi:hypothetical protein